jgi:pimeloyl-ACP methyl ester carboxylesterase
MNCVKFFSGFCVEGERELFAQYLPSREAYVAGFSYGAIEAIEYATSTKEFFKKLILLSPAYYAHKDEEFCGMQYAAFVADPQLYRIKLLKRSGLDEETAAKYAKMGTKEELDKLLHFKWSAELFETLKVKGVSVEIYIGSADRVVESEASAQFFRQYGAVYYIKNKNHFLR